MNRNLSGSVSSPDLIDSKLEEDRTSGSKHCLGCGHKLDRQLDWVGLPAGVKFDPTDQELIEHLEAKVNSNSEDLRSHPLIDEFIPTIEGEDGICYTHPEKLPGVTRDGLSKHFFHRPSKAYTTGTRKRRKIQTESDLQGGETRWHKTGKTRPVVVNGRHKGCKKILVLYTNFGKHRKPEKTNWVMHQYHLGEHEEEKEGELVVSKIFYQTQPRQCNWSEKGPRDSGGSGSSSSKEKEAVGTREDLASVAAGISAGYSASVQQHMHHLKADHFSLSPFGKRFDEVEMGESTRENACKEQEEANEHERGRSMVVHQHPNSGQEQQHRASAFHVNRPSDLISGILTPLPLHHTTSHVILDDPYHRSLLPNDGLQHQQQAHNHHKLIGRPTSELEELIMGCTTSGLGKEPSNHDAQGTEWLKYSYWADPENPYHNG